MRERAKNLLRIFEKKYKETFGFKVLTWLVVVAICVALTFFIEDFIFLSGRFRHYDEPNPDEFKVYYENIKQNTDGTLESTENLGTISYRFPKTYIYKLRFKGMSPTNKPVDYEVVCDESYPVNNVDFYAAFNNSTETFVIDSVCTGFDIVIFKSQGIPFSIELTEFNYDFNRNEVRMGSTFILLLLFAYTFLCISGCIEMKLERMAAVYLLVVGLLLSFLIPPRYTYDEYAHLLKAQSTSYGKLHTEMVDTLYRPFAFDNLNTVNFRSLDDFHYYLSYYQRHIKDKGIDDIITSAANSYTFVPYIFSALGLVVARHTGLSVYFYTFFARAGNVIFFTVCLYFAIKIFPSNKLLMAYTAMFPIMMTMIAATGTGVMQIAALYLGMALVAHYIVDKDARITAPAFFFMLLLFSVVTFCRMTYGFLTLILLLLPKEKFKDEWLARSFRFIIVFVAFALMVFVFYYAEHISLNLVDNQGSDMNEQMKNILEDPLTFVYRMFVYNMNMLVSGDLLMDASYIIFTGRLWTAFVLVQTILYVFLFLAGDKDKLAFDNPKSRWLLWLTFILSIGASEVAIYLTFSEVNQLVVTGFQARYVISIILVPLLTFESGRFYLQYDKRRLTAFTMFYSLVMLALTVGNYIVKYYR